jgi:capsular exopolysaccharide synthesis family protein
MLKHTSQRYQQPSFDDLSDERQFISLSDVWRFVADYWKIIAACIVASVGVSVVYIVTATPYYTAQAQLLIETNIPDSFRDRQIDSMATLDAPQVESQLALIRSDRIAEKVVQRLGLLDEAPPKPPTSLFAVVKSWLGLGREPAQATPQEQTAHLRGAIDRIRGNLGAERDGLSYAINIWYRDPDPETAARIANAIADSYVDDRLETRAQAARRSSKWLEARIDDLRKQMNNAALKVQQFKAKRDYRIIGMTDKGKVHGGEVPQQPAKPAPSTQSEAPETLAELESRAETYRKIFESYLQGYAESMQRQSYPMTNARVISPATKPSGKSHPRRMMALATGFGFGALIGFGIAFLLSSLDRKVRTPRQVRDELGLECLGKVPNFRNGVHGMHRWSLGGILRRTLSRLRGLPSYHGFDDDVAYRLTEVRDLPFSRFSDSVKSVRTAINLAGKTRPLHTIGITSAMPREGKTTLTYNLATLYAGGGIRTLVIDADVHNPTLSRIVAPNCKVGLVEALNRKEELNRCVRAGEPGAPDILPIASAREAVAVADLLGAPAMQKLIENLREYYELIVFDLPPLKPVVDGIALCSLLDGVVLVAEAGGAQIPVLGEVIHDLRRVSALPLGIVLTKVEDATEEFYYHSYRSRSYGVEA